jgi:hypothetical protein
MKGELNMKRHLWQWRLMTISLLIAAGGSGAELSATKAEMMGRVEDFFMHNFRDVTSRKSLEWGEVTTNAEGNRAIRYRYEARIWDKEVMLMNQSFTFDKQGKFLAYTNETGFPKKKESKSADTSTKQGLMQLVDDFFHDNFRDITSREALDWGEPVKAENGNVSIRYKYRARIWDKDVKIIDQVFTFDPKGGFVSVKNVSERL